MGDHSSCTGLASTTGTFCSHSSDAVLELDSVCQPAIDSNEGTLGSQFAAVDRLLEALPGSTCQHTVVLLHGFCESSTIWTDGFLQQLPRKFLSRHRFLAVDLLGFGRSPKPYDCRYTVEEHVR